MNTLDTTKETSNSWSPYKVETKQFLEDAKRETFANMVKAMVGNTFDDTKVYVLYGCEISGSGPYTINAGAIFCKDVYAQANNLPGEVFTVPAASITLTGGNVIVTNLSDTADLVADPTIFSDNVSQNIHRVRQAVFVAGASGSGTLTGNNNCDFGNFISARARIATQIVSHPANYTVPSTSFADVTDLTITTPNDGVTRKYKLQFRADVQNANAASSLVQLRFYNTTDAASYAATGYIGVDTADPSHGDQYTFGTHLFDIQTIGPNKTITVQALYLSAAPFLQASCFMIEEIS